MRDMLDIIWQRHSCRAPFDEARSIPESHIERLLDAARWAPTAHNLQNFEIVVVDDRHRNRYSRSATIAAMAGSK